MFRHPWLLVALGSAFVVAAVVASWVFYFGPDQEPQRWVVVSAGWGECATSNFCEVRGTFRNDGGTAPNRYLPTSVGAFGDVYAYTAFFEVTPAETCGALLDPKTHHGQSVTVACGVSSADTRLPVKVEIQSEDRFKPQ